jgi:molecular chaperone GrpE
MKKKQEDPIDQAEVAAGRPEDPLAPLSESVELIEPPEEAIQRLEEALDQTKDQLLRTAAEFDNFRKRTAKERQDMRAKAQADLALNVLEALDDLNRVVNLDLAEASTKDVIDGVEMVERKLLQHLELSGLKRVGVQGDKFDPNEHEAIGMVPTTSEEDDGMVANVVRAGYRFGGSLLRPARVLVHMLQAEEGDA